jgi:hypothetical protein
VYSLFKVGQSLAEIGKETRQENKTEKTQKVAENDETQNKNTTKEKGTKQNYSPTNNRKDNVQRNPTKEHIHHSQTPTKKEDRIENIKGKANENKTKESDQFSQAMDNAAYNLLSTPEKIKKARVGESVYSRKQKLFLAKTPAGYFVKSEHPLIGKGSYYQAEIKMKKPDPDSKEYIPTSEEIQEYKEEKQLDKVMTKENVKTKTNKAIKNKEDENKTNKQMDQVKITPKNMTHPTTLTCLKVNKTFYYCY